MSWVSTGSFQTETVAIDPGVDGLMCVDLEGWHQIVLRRFGGPARHCGLEFRRGLDALLQLLSDAEQRATFFVLGMTVAEDPDVMPVLAGEGHELATHGWGHRHLERLDRAAFTADLLRARDDLQQRTGQPVIGHRAPEFSVPRAAPGDFFSVLAEAGFAYDSSVVPASGARYGLSGFPRVPTRVRCDGGALIELPLATVGKPGGGPQPIAGGGMWRLLPRPALKAACRRARAEGVLLTLYVHNYEFDPAFLHPAGHGPLDRGWKRVTVQQNIGRRSMPRKLKSMLAEHRFTSCRDFLERSGLL